MNSFFAAYLDHFDELATGSFYNNGVIALLLIASLFRYRQFFTGKLESATHTGIAILCILSLYGMFAAICVFPYWWNEGGYSSEKVAYSGLSFLGEIEGYLFPYAIAALLELPLQIALITRLSTTRLRLQRSFVLLALAISLTALEMVRYATRLYTLRMSALAIRESEQ